MNSLRLTAVLLLVAAAANAEVESSLQHAGSLGGIRLAGSDEPAAQKVYIVQLKEPSAAGYAAKATPRAFKAGAPIYTASAPASTALSKTFIEPAGANSSGFLSFLSIIYLSINVDAGGEFFFQMAPQVSANPYT